MAYSVYGDVQSEFKSTTFGASTKITSTEVTEFISQADAMIDGIVSGKYVTPVTGSESLKIVKMISINLVAGRIWNILEREGTDAKNKGHDLIEFAKAMLKKITEGKLELSDATSIASTTFESYNKTNAIVGLIDKDTDQW